LISAELYGRSFYTGGQLKTKICLINDQEEGLDLPQTQLIWSITCEGKTLLAGQENIAPVAHAERVWTSLQIDLPEKTRYDKAKCQLNLSIENGKIISKNQYDILLIHRDFLSLDDIPNDKLIALFDPSGETDQLMDTLGIRYAKLKDLTEIRLLSPDLLIVANLDQEEEVPYGWEDVRSICGNGTNTLLIHPGKHLKWLFYEKIASVYERKGRVVNMHIPEHGAFEGIGPMELAWWQQAAGQLPRACRRSFRLNQEEGTRALATYLRPHTGLGKDRAYYLNEMSGIPLLEIQHKKGRLIASEMETNQGAVDPIAGKVFVNLLRSLLKPTGD
jgi:hypothetical protein